MPTVEAPPAAIVAATAIAKSFPSREGRRGGGREILSGVDVAVGRGEIVGLVGESGCGKSTLSRIIVGIERQSAGEVLHEGRPVRSRADWRALRRDVQYVFQDPYGSLPPRMRIGALLSDTLAINAIGTKESRREQAVAALRDVGLPPSALERRPSAFSGGQRQRIGIARALVLEPRVVICDEVVSGLDVSVQAQVLNLLLELQDRRRLGLLFISHDLRVVRYLCDRVLVMRDGVIVEQGETEEVFERPQHAYTRELIAASPSGRRPRAVSTPTS